MSSSIFFKFKSQKEPSQITFDGTSLSVFEVKREIIAYNKLGDGTDFDLEIYSADTSEVYDDDTVQIPRSTTVIARRLPASKPGAGKAARYVSGKMPVTAKNQHRIESMNNSEGKSTAVTQATTTSAKPLSEEERLQAMFSENKASWQEAQAEIAAKGVNNRPFFQKTAPVPDKPVPEGYVCHRCGQKGHWIQACPTNNDPTFDGRPKFRRTTGIPKSFLQKIDKPLERDEEGKIDVSKLPSGVMYTPEGEWVISRPDEASWQKFQQQNQASAEKQKEAEEELQEIRELGLECSLCHKLFDDPIKTPCCQTTYCRACAENELIEKDFACPNCGKQVLLDDLVTDDEMAKKVTEYKEEKEVRKQAAVETTMQMKPEQSAGEINGDSPKATSEKAASRSPPSSASKKRPADGELENNRKPSGPVAMEKSSSKDSTSKAGIPSNPNPSAMQVPSNLNDFIAQMNQMSGNMVGMPNGMPNFNNNPAMMMPNGMPGMMQMGPMMGMPGFNMNNPAMMMPNNMMPNMGMGNMMPMGGFGPNNNQFNNGGIPTGPRGWQGNQGWNGNNMGPNMNGGNDGAYMRQPVNPNRHRGRQGRPRSMDYKQV